MRDGIDLKRWYAIVILAASFNTNHAIWDGSRSVESHTREAGGAESKPHMRRENVVRSSEHLQNRFDVGKGSGKSGGSGESDSNGLDSSEDKGSGKGGGSAKGGGKIPVFDDDDADASDDEGQEDASQLIRKDRTFGTVDGKGKEKGKRKEKEALPQPPREAETTELTTTVKPAIRDVVDIEMMHGNDASIKLEAPEHVLKFGSALGYAQSFMDSDNSSGWALVQNGTLIQGLITVDGVMEEVFFTSVRDDSPQAQRYNTEDSRRYVDLDCTDHKFMIAGKGLHQCPEGAFLSGFHSKCNDTSTQIGLSCIESARCCKPRAARQAWGNCQPWEQAMANIIGVDGKRGEVMQCSSKAEAVVGVYISEEGCLSKASRCIQGLKCCQPPDVGVCGSCFPFVPRADRPNFCKGKVCEPDECCQGRLRTEKPQNAIKVGPAVKKPLLTGSTGEGLPGLPSVAPQRGPPGLPGSR